MTDYIIEDFIGIFDNVLSPEYCNMVIEHAKYLENWKKFSSRQQSNPNTKKTDKDNFTYHLEQEDDHHLMSSDAKFAFQFSKAFWEICYPLYTEKYGVIGDMSEHAFSETIKIQKTLKGGGYHQWHCEHDGYMNGRRMLLVVLYLNDVDSGGETEFLYQSKRVQAKQGRLIVCPAGFTHTHRGNPPLSGEKYIMNTWVEFKK